MTDNIDDTLALMEKIERDNIGNPAVIANLEEQYEILAQALHTSTAFLMRRNRFRVAHAEFMRIRRPKLLFGHRAITTLNFQSVPAVRSADVVFLIEGESRVTPPAVDMLVTDPYSENFTEVLKKLPKGFMPDLYFDYQVCTCKTFISGMEDAPFPTAVSLCHLFYTRRCEEIAQLFDFVLPLSPVLSERMKQSVAPAKIIDVPFGLSWGGFEEIVRPDPNTERDIDVLLSFSGTEADPVYGTCRLTVHRLFREAQEKWKGRYNLVYPGTISKPEYLALLKRSRIVLNAVGIHGPYNYRTNEAVAAGALLMQMEGNYITGPQHMEAILEPDKEYVSFTPSDFHEKLDRLLQNEALRTEIANRGELRMRTEYSYSALYQKFFSEIFSPERSDWKSRRCSADRALFARLGIHLQSPEMPQKETEPAYLSVDDIRNLFEMNNFPTPKVLMPLYERLAVPFRMWLFNGIFKETQKFSDTAISNLMFYDAMMGNLNPRSAVDWYNYVILCAANGRADARMVRKVIATLDSSELSLSHNEMLRICTGPKLLKVSASQAAYANVAIYNLPALMTNNHDIRQASARDYMLFWLYALMVQLEGPEEWQYKIDKLLASYPVEIAVQQ